MGGISKNDLMQLDIDQPKYEKIGKNGVFISKSIQKKNAQLFYIQPNNITIDVSMHSCIIYFLSKIKFELNDIFKKNPLSDNIFSRFFENIVYTS